MPMIAGAGLAATRLTLRARRGRRTLLTAVRRTVRRERDADDRVLRAADFRVLLAGRARRAGRRTVRRAAVRCAVVRLAAVRRRAAGRRRAVVRRAVVRRADERRTVRREVERAEVRRRLFAAADLRVVLATLLAVRRTRATTLRAVRRTAFTRRTATRAFGRDEVVLFDRERDDTVARLRARDALLRVEVRFRAFDALFFAAAIRLPPNESRQNHRRGARYSTVRTQPPMAHKYCRRFSKPHTRHAAIDSHSVHLQHFNDPRRPEN